MPPSLFCPQVGRVEEISVAALAYLGDAVFELHVRLQSIQPPISAKAYHQLVVAQVRAESQARYLDRLILSDAERDLVRRGRNAAGAPSRHLDPEIYRKASGFEALVGYLYLTDPERLAQVLGQLDD